MSLFIRQTASFFNALLYLLLTPFCIIFKRTCVSAFNAHLPSELTQLTHQLCQFLTLHNKRDYKAVARLLELNVYTVRDWGRAFKAGKFRVSDEELGEAATVVDLREDQILDLRRQGFDDRTIALRIGLSLQTV